MNSFMQIDKRNMNYFSQKEIDNLDSLKFIKDTKWWVKTFPKQNLQVIIASLVNSTK